MNGKIDWKSKYAELRSKYMNAIDAAFRLGFEEGQREAEMENLQQQVTEMEEAQAMAEQEAMMGDEGMVDEEGMPIEGGEEMGMEGEELPEEPGLDESIDELEGMVKNEKKSLDVAKIMKSMHKSEDTKKLESEKTIKINKLLSKI